ncbi:gamma-tubulin complex component 6 isoform X1 [Felis catus]|uniref:Tubulin gamma complex associated protein 6 n=1 Tax=Felis catus TaxID=9685 RepID=A0ABI7ZXK1_FELCA|nr:gamma-tubulin complex component 6 isoform X1 [Felis catus]XP_044918495.1 gamma-tubulin complex component 6 isoform X1 [Felis catus]XP_044918496.1 gamma-tubulin complex component 6 isoform X1 [Felis catus]XP_044918497.1 gamma-tubulin complex component 6 isoform X1 [Felis catus]
MASVPQLFDDLCEALLPAAKARLGQRGVSRKRAKQGLKRVAYNALFTNLFQEETHKLQADLSKLPVKNKVLLLSFDLRAGGLGPEADRLEELVEELQAAPGCPLTEVASVLDLLVRLAGSGPPQVLQRKRDYFFNNKHVGRNVPYSGYDCYDLSVFEMDVQSLISREEYLCQDMVRKALQVMEAAPGTGLPTVGLFSYGDPCSDRFERDTRVSLFGALVHSRTYDMDVRLDLPPMPDSADLSGLAIKVPQSVDQSEDEGFQSASNLTPDSQSEPGMTPDIDLWDAVLTYEASKRRCWEQVGCPPGHKEEPYLTEAGRDTFDRFCRLRQGELQVLGGGLLQAPQPVLVKECELVKDALNVLIGVVSTTFSLCQPAQTFMVRRGVHVSGASPESISSLLSEVAECGTHYARLSQFSLQPLLDSSCSKGLVLQAFTSGLRRYLQYYRACVLSTPPTLSLLTIGFLFKKLGRQLRYLAELCGVGGGGPRAEFPTGVRLLSYLYQEALDNCSNEHYPVLLSLLQTSCEPYTRFIHDWVYSGLFRDTYGEFMIQVNHEYLGFRDKFYWTHGYVLISKEVEDCVPVFLKHIAHDVYVCGKTINLLKLCCPRHYLCWSDVPVPRISVIFSPEELKEVERDCAIYVGRMERVARHSSISKEEKELRMEIAKQELIVQAREAASRVLRALSDRQTSERMALDARKREQFQRLKEQFVRDQERRRAARQEDPDGDFGYARELRDRERRLRALEEQLERKARQALVDHYSKLSAEAARREQKALWKIQRHRLAGARLRFLVEDERRTREMLKDVCEKSSEAPAVLPGARSQASSPGPEHLAGGSTCDSGYAGRHVAAYDCPSAQTPRLPRPLVAAVCGPQPERVGRPGPFSEGLGIQDFLPTAREAGEAEHAGVAPILEQALQTIGSDLPPSAVSEVAGTEPSGPQEYDFRTILRPAVVTLASPASLQTVGGGSSNEGQQLWGDSLMQLENTCVPDGPMAVPHSHPPRLRSSQEGSSQAMGQLLGHVPGGSIPAGGYASGMAPSRPQWNVHGHVSDASIKVGENVCDVAPSRPRWNVHGHVSDASIKVGENVCDVAPSRPRWNVHGHVSDASIKVGENVCDVAPSRPRWNVHGHVSDASIKVGENVCDVAPSRPRWNVHGHVSDASIKVGENVCDVAPSRPRWNVHGHVSDASIKVGENVCDVAPSRPRWNVHGHVSDASIKVGENVCDVAPARPRWNVHGHVSQSRVVLGALSGEDQPDTPAPYQSPTDHESQSGLSLGAQSPVGGHEPRRPADRASDGSCSHVVSSGSGEASDQASLSAVAASGALGDSIPEEPGRSGDTEDLSPSHPSSSQEGVATGSSPGLGEEEAAAQRWGQEQAYLTGLAEQYRLEQYPDSYEAMSEPPVAHLLHHGLPRAFSLPEEPRVRSDADETAVELSELLPLPVLMKHSITAPLAAHVSLVNKAAVDYYFVELGLEAHFEALRHFLLMEDGEFAQSLSDLLFEKLGAGQTPGELLNPLVLNSVLSKALQYSLHGDTPYAANLSFALKFLPEAFAPNAPDVLNCLELRYKVDWPLNIVVTESCLSRYSGIFSFLLQLKLMMWTLKDICFHLKRAALVSRAAGSVQFRQLQLFKHEMQHFVKVTQGYIANQILHVTWCEFRARLAGVGDLEEIQRAHAEYLHKAVFRGLLTEKAAPVMNVIHSIFSLVLKFRSQLISQPWVPAGGPRGAEHPNFALMQQSYSTFKYYSHFLFKVVTKLVNRGYQPHLEDFLLRINFNSYYQDA